MQRASFLSRFLIPTAIAVLMLLGSHAIYRASTLIDNETIHQELAFIAGLVHLFVLMGGSLIVYPITFFRGAKPLERVVACLVTPILWAVMEIVRVSDFFTLGESLYYGLNSQVLTFLSFASIQMGVCDMICRWLVRRKNSAEKRIFRRPAVISVVFGLVAVYIIMVWGQGVHWFYLYQQGYKWLFL
jgi:cytochrome c biogenesis protein CcdA